MSCQPKVHHSTRVEFDAEEDPDGAEEEVDDWQEIARLDVFGMIFQEGVPILRMGTG